MNIRLITDHHLNSGIGRYSFELGQALRALDHNVVLSKPYKKDADDVEFHQNHSWISKIHYRSLRDLHPYLLPYFIGSQLVSSKADVYHAHWFMAGLGLLKVKNIIRKPKVITMHDVSLLHEIEREGKFLNYYKKALDRFADEETPIIVVSESAKNDALKHSSLKEDQVHAVHNGVNFNQFYPLDKEKNDRFKIVYAGGLAPRKNLGLLLNACKILEAKNIDYSLEIAGAYPERTPFPKMAEEMKLKNVAFVGFIPDDIMNEFYNQANLFVFTSKYEGFGFAPLEAMATGTPVITTKGGSLEEVSGEGAALVYYNAEALAYEIIMHMEDSKKLARLADKGLAWVKQYTWTKCATETLDVYQKA